MYKAVRITLKPDITKPSNCIDIDEIQLQTGDVKIWFKKATVHDLVNKGIKVVVSVPGVVHEPELEAVVSPSGEKYVRSEKDDIKSDNLLNLPLGK